MTQGEKKSANNKIFLIAMLLAYVIWEISEGRIVGTVFELSNRFVSRIVTLRERGGVPRYLGLGT